MPSRGFGRRPTRSWSTCGCASRPTERRSPSAAGRSGSRAGASDAPGIRRRRPDRARARRPHHACATACTCPPTSTGPTAPAGSARSSSTSPTARTTCARCRTAARTSCWSRRGLCACGSTCAARAAPRVWPWTSTPRPSSSTASRWSTGSRARSGATATSGSWGKSYGGFSCIQLAARRPPALRAIAPVYATDDRYTDDMHYDGGAVAAFELSNYPIRMIGMNALPPGEGEGPDFDRRWRERIDADPALGGAVADRAARRRVLAQRLAATRLRAHRVPGLHRRRLARRLPHRRAADGAAAAKLLAAPGRAVGACRARPRRATAGVPLHARADRVLPHAPRPRFGRARCARAAAVGRVHRGARLARARPRSGCRASGSRVPRGPPPRRRWC